MTELTHGFEDSERYKLGHILYDSLPSKFLPLFGNRRTAISYLSNALRPERCIIAREHGQVVGIAGLQFKGVGYLDSRLVTLFRHLRWGILRAIVNGWLLESKVKDDELYLDTLAVAQNHRGRGIGTKLIQAVVNLAATEGLFSIRLFVTDSNPRAKSLYERMGFSIKSCQTIPFPWRRSLGFAKAFEMVAHIQY